MTDRKRRSFQTRVVRRSNRPLAHPRATELEIERLELRLLLSGFGLWQHMPEASAATDQPAMVRAVAMELYDLQESVLTELLSEVPSGISSGTPSVVVEVPNPDNVLQRFRIEETAVMHPELAAKFPQIRTFRGQGIDDPSAKVWFDVTPLGFHAQVLSTGGAWYVDPLYHLDTSVYASYYRQDYRIDPQLLDSEWTSCMSCACGDETSEDSTAGGHGGGCGCAACAGSSLLTVDASQPVGSAQGLAPDTIGQGQGSAWGSSSTVVGPFLSFAGDGGGGGGESVEQQLRTYQLAVAATGEYTAFFGGTVNNGLAAIVTAVNRVTGIYETELAVRLQLVPNNNLLVYTNSATDPYSNNSGGTMLSQNQTTIDAVIGDGNYDIGHVFSTGGGGVAFLGVVGVSGFKARGVTGLPNPVGDVFYVDYVAHEMGHQFGGNHTFNGDSGSCSGSNRNGATAYEPGSGTTIMAYAGICGNDNLQLNSDPYFHHESLREIRNYVTTGAGNAAATITNTGNEIPTIEAGLNYAIPANTPFELTASGSDLGGGSLTYSWEERDLGPQRDLSAPDNGSSPLFRVWNPTSNPTRVFPRLTDLLNNTINIGEKLPTTNRTMTFRVTARDNFAGGGGTAFDDMTVTSVVTGASFAVTIWNSATPLTGGTSQTVTWNVAGTTSSPINAANVDLLWSTDGGLTFPYVLAAGVPNDGAHSINVPNIPTTQGRLKIKGSVNIFFDVNNANLTVTRGNVLVAGEITNLTDAWQTITLAQWFADPIVSVGPVQLADGEPGTVRVRNVTGNSFQVQFAEWDYLDGIHPAETASYLVMERGLTTLANGKIFQAGSVAVDHNFATVPFASAFSGTPVVLTTVASANGPETVVSRLQNPTTSDFSLQLQEEEGNDGQHGFETVNYIATLPGTGNSSGLNYEVGLAPAVTHKSLANRFHQTFLIAPRLLATMQTKNFSDPATVRLRRLDAKQFTPFIEEEQSADVERGHGAEIVGFFAFRLSSALMLDAYSANPLADDTGENDGTRLGWAGRIERESGEHAAERSPAGALPASPTALERVDLSRTTRRMWAYYNIDELGDIAELGTIDELVRVDVNATATLQPQAETRLIVVDSDL